MNLSSSIDAECAGKHLPDSPAVELRFLRKYLDRIFQGLQSGNAFQRSPTVSGMLVIPGTDALAVLNEKRGFRLSESPFRFMLIVSVVARQCYGRYGANPIFGNIGSAAPRRL